MLNLLNLPNSHPVAWKLLSQHGISVNRTGFANRCAVDITIEQAINCHVKSSGGIVGFSRNQSAYYRWCMARHARASYSQATLEMADMDSQEDTSHKDLRKSQIIQVKKIPPKLWKQYLTSSILMMWRSGRISTVCHQVSKCLLMANKTGQEAYSSVIKERLVEKTKSFNAPSRRLSVKTFVNAAKSIKVTGKSKKSRQVIAESNTFGQLMLHDISLERVFGYPLGPVPWALATADGTHALPGRSRGRMSCSAETSLWNQLHH